MNNGRFWKLLAAGCALSLAAVAQEDLELEVAGFRVPEYDTQGVMTSQLFGDRAEMEGKGEVKITGLRMEFYREGKTVMRVSSPYCFYNQKTREARSDAPVAADLDQVEVRGRGFLFKAGESTVKIFNESQVTLRNVLNQLEVPIVSGEAIAPTEGSNTVTVITSRELYLDYKSRRVRFEGAVHVQDPKMEMNCDALEIQIGPDHQINWITASTDVRIRSGGREALAGKASYDAKTDEFLLEDQPRLVDGKNVLTGETIRFWRSSRRMVCEPSARMVVYSSEQLKTGLFGK
jgi:lipopolysaccharide export system protein LptA